MNDLISRQEAIDALESGKDKTAKGDIGGFYNAIIQNNMDKLRNLPSAESRKKGKWIEKSTNGEMFSSCSVCGYIEWDVPRKFCPNCGCQMNGGEDDEID